MRRYRAFSLCPFAQNFGILFEIRTKLEVFDDSVQSAAVSNAERVGLWFWS